MITRSNLCKVPKNKFGGVEWGRGLVGVPPVLLHQIIQWKDDRD
jgi:hypothetical protein